MTESEFKSEINSSKRWKTINYSIFGAIVAALGFFYLINFHWKIYGEFYGPDVFHYALGSFFSLLGLSVIHSSFAKRKIHTLNNSNDQYTNQKLTWRAISVLGGNDYLIEDNFTTTTVRSRLLKNGYVINLLSMNNRILYNIDVPGQKERGISAPIATFRLKRKLLHELGK